MKKLRPRKVRCALFVVVFLVIGILIGARSPHQETPIQTAEAKVELKAIPLEEKAILTKVKQNGITESVEKGLKPVEATVTTAVVEEPVSYQDWDYQTVAAVYNWATSSNDGTISDYEKQMMAQLLYGEANSVASEAERAMVIWTILNRYDSGVFGDSVSEIVSAPMQFTGYDSSNPVTDANLSLVEDVVDRWERENAGEENVGRTLPEEYCYFVADSDPSAGEWHNAFYAYEYGNQGEKVWYDYENPDENPY